MYVLFLCVLFNFFLISIFFRTVRPFIAFSRDKMFAYPQNIKNVALDYYQSSYTNIISITNVVHFIDIELHRQTMCALYRLDFSSTGALYRHDFSSTGALYRQYFSSTGALYRHDFSSTGHFIESTFHRLLSYFLSTALFIHGLISTRPSNMKLSIALYGSIGIL